MGRKSAKTIGDIKILLAFLESQTFTVPNKLASGPDEGGQWIPKKSGGVPCGSRTETRPIGVLGPSQGSSQEVPSGLSALSPSLHTTPSRWRCQREARETKVAFTQSPPRGDQTAAAGLQPRSRELSCDSELKNV